MKSKPNIDFSEVVKNFCFDGELTELIPYGFGHINDTYKLSFKTENGLLVNYILQRINHNVFKEPEKLMENIYNVTRYLRKRIIEIGGDPERETLNLIPTIGGGYFYKSASGDYWRAYVFIGNAQTYQVVESLSHFYNAGKAFGKFQNLLHDYPAETLHETIPDFHNTKKRFDTFVRSVEKDAVNRACTAKKEIEFILKREEETVILLNLLHEGKLPLKVTHNDTKFNNVMIDDKTGEGICVIDLDTVMPGLSLYDFGDAIRSGANPAEEDERDLSKICMDLNLYEHFTRGFLEATGQFLTPLEIEYLPFAAKIMTFECGIRFLTDYLDGDKYFKVHREEHNLDRARTQLKMVSDMENKTDQMRAIVAKYAFL